MEEKYKQVTSIITQLAATNPYITKEQVAKAKSMYNGDTRPIEVIRAELEAYSEEIMRQGEKAKNAKKMEGKKEEKSPVPKPVYPMLHPTILSEEEFVGPNDSEDEKEEILESLRVKLPTEEEQRQLQNMIDEALGENNKVSENEYSYNGEQKSNEQGKVLVKNPPKEQTPPSESGYGNVPALLALTVIFSIVTIIIAFFTIMSS